MNYFSIIIVRIFIVPYEHRTECWLFGYRDELFWPIKFFAPEVRILLGGSLRKFHVFEDKQKSSLFAENFFVFLSYLMLVEKFEILKLFNVIKLLSINIVDLKKIFTWIRIFSSVPDFTDQDPRSNLSFKTQISIHCLTEEKFSDLIQSNIIEDR